MPAVIGVFDDPRVFEEALTHLAEADFHDGEISIVDESGKNRFQGLGVGPAVVVEEAAAGGDAGAGRRRPEIEPRSIDAGGLRRELEHLKLPEEELAYYARALSHRGRLVVIETDEARAREAMNVLSNVRAERIHWHD